MVTHKMRILVFSDSHGRVGPMQDMVERCAPDAVFHLGDVVRDGDKLQELYPKLPFYRVCGNCDWGNTAYQPEAVARLGGKTILYMHGHTQGVKTGHGLAVRAARAIQADLLLFGHTHRAFCDDYGDLLAVNPGAAQNGCGALLTWEAAGPITCELLAL